MYHQKSLISYNTVNLRIGANSSTLCEGLITSGLRNITAVVGNLLICSCDGSHTILALIVAY